VNWRLERLAELERGLRQPPEQKVGTKTRAAGPIRGERTRVAPIRPDSPLFAGAFHRRLSAVSAPVRSGKRGDSEPDPFVRPLAVRREDAARMCGVSLRHFERHIQPHVRTVAIGGRVVIPVSELERYLELQGI
jgi:hypothetical protein